MDWSNESYVRLYVRDTVTWKRLRWQGQCVLMQLLRKLDRAGVMDGIEDITVDVSIMTGLPDDVVSTGMESLLKEGVFEHNGCTLFMPNFLDAQETPKSDRQRQRESRERRRINAFKEYTPEQCHGIVNRAILNKQLTPMPCEICGAKTNIEAHHDDYSMPINVRWMCRSCHKKHHMSQNVTLQSQDVTERHDVTASVTAQPLLSLYPLPSSTSTSAVIEECKRTPKKNKTTNPKSMHETTVTFVEVFNEVFGRKIRSIGIIDKRVRELLSNGYDDWKILIMPIIQQAIDPNTGTTRNFDPLMLIRTGEHGRTGENGATYGKTDWIQRAHGNADKFYADARLSKIAYKHGLADILEWMMKGIVKDETNQIPQMRLPGMAPENSRTGDKQEVLPNGIGENRQAGNGTGAVQ